jgi:hypothetical protein
MGRELKQASIHVVSGYSLVVPLVVDGLPQAIEALGRRWQRKREFHLTAVAARVIDEVGAGADDIWDRVTSVASGRYLGPIRAGREVRRATHPDQPQLQTLIVLVACPGLEELYGDLSSALGAALTPPPAHVTLYSTDPVQGIGITTGAELAARAPALSEAEQEEARAAMSFP